MQRSGEACSSCTAHTCQIYLVCWADLSNFCCRLSAPWGTEDSPVQVTSAFSERVVGVPDPYDDSIVWWASIKEGEPPKQIVDDGAYSATIGDGSGHPGALLISQPWDFSGFTMSCRFIDDN